MVYEFINSLHHTWLALLHDMYRLAHCLSILTLAMFVFNRTLHVIWMIQRFEWNQWCGWCLALTQFKRELKFILKALQQYWLSEFESFLFFAHSLHFTTKILFEFTHIITIE